MLHRQLQSQIRQFVFPYGLSEIVHRLMEVEAQRGILVGQGIRRPSRYDISVFRNKWFFPEREVFLVNLRQHYLSYCLAMFYSVDIARICSHLVSYVRVVLEHRHKVGCFHQRFKTNSEGRLRNFRVSEKRTYIRSLIKISHQYEHLHKRTLSDSRLTDKHRKRSYLQSVNLLERANIMYSYIFFHLYVVIRVLH